MFYSDVSDTQRNTIIYRKKFKSYIESLMK